MRLRPAKKPPPVWVFIATASFIQAHGVGLAVDRLAGREVDRHRLHDVAVDLIAHGSPPHVVVA